MARRGNGWRGWLTTGCRNRKSFTHGRTSGSPSNSEGGSRMRESRTYGSVRVKVGLLALAKQFDNVSQACKMMGYSRHNFYRFKSCTTKAANWRYRRSAGVRDPGSPKPRSCAPPIGFPGSARQGVPRRNTGSPTPTGAQHFVRQVLHVFQNEQSRQPAASAKAAGLDLRCTHWQIGRRETANRSRAPAAPADEQDQ